MSDPVSFSKSARRSFEASTELGEPVSDLTPAEREVMLLGAPKDHVGHYEMGYLAARYYYLSKSPNVASKAALDYRRWLEAAEDRIRVLEEALVEVEELATEYGELLKVNGELGVAAATMQRERDQAQARILVLELGVRW